MQIVLPGQVNCLSLECVNRVNGLAITAGAVTFYLQSLDGANAGKWFRASDSTWQTTEVSAGAGTHVSKGHWKVTIPATAWVAGVRYLLYLEESDSLNIASGVDILCFSMFSSSSYSPAPTAGAVASAVWEEVLAGHGDPDSAAAVLSSRSSHSAADVWAESERTLSAFSFAVDVSSDGIDAILRSAITGFGESGTVGAALNRLDASISSRLAAADYLAPENTTIQQVHTLIVGLNNLSTSNVTDAVNAALTAYGVPTATLLLARTLVATDYATLSAVTSLEAAIGNLDTTGSAEVVSACETALANYGSATSAQLIGRTLLATEYATAEGLAALPTAATIKTTLEEAGSKLDAIYGKLPADTIGTSILTTSDVRTAMDAQGYTTARASYLDALNGIVAAIWGAMGGIGQWLLDNMLVRTTWTDARAARLDHLTRDIPETVTLAEAQPLYAPAKAGDAMTLTSDYDAIKTAANADALAAVVATINGNILAASGSVVTAINSHGDAYWLTATGFATAQGLADARDHVLAAVDSRLAAADYVVPDNAGIGKLAALVETVDGADRFTAAALSQVPIATDAPTATEIVQALEAEGTQLQTIYSLLPESGKISNFAGGPVEAVTEPVVVGVNNDKTGYHLVVAPPTAEEIRLAIECSTVLALAAMQPDYKPTVLENGRTVATLQEEVVTLPSAPPEGWPQSGEFPTPQAVQEQLETPGGKLDAIYQALPENGVRIGTSVFEGGMVEGVVNPVTAGTVQDKTGYALTEAYDAAKTAAQTSDLPQDYQKAGEPVTLNPVVMAALVNVDVPVSSRASAADYTHDRALKLDRLDVAVSTRQEAGASVVLPDGYVVGQVPILDEVGDINLVQYDDYRIADGRQLRFGNTTNWLQGDFEGAKAYFTIMDLQGAWKLHKEGAVVSTDAGDEVHVELTSEETGQLTRAGRQYRYQLLLVGDHRETEVTGMISVTLSLYPPEQTP